MADTACSVCTSARPEDAGAAVPLFGGDHDAELEAALRATLESGQSMAAPASTGPEGALKDIHLFLEKGLFLGKRDHRPSLAECPVCCRSLPMTLFAWNTTLSFSCCWFTPPWTRSCPRARGSGSV